jgi:hypothetical protein
MASIRMLAIDFIGKLHGRLMVGRHRVGGVVDVRSVLNDHLRVLLGAKYGSRQACVISDVVDALVNADCLPRRIDLRWQSGAHELQDWLNGLH